jgi:hypothetical protein
VREVNLLRSPKNILVQSLVFLLGLFLGLHPVLSECRAEERLPQIDPLSKITFNLEPFNEQGLYGPPGGLRALDYEFCIPGDAAHEAQVRRIDPTVKIYKKSSGRIGCAAREYLCVGNTHQPDFKTVLLRLAGLPYVKRIDQAFFE